jgi:hypothetical protein
VAKPKGQLPKAYLRVDPNLDSTHPRPGDFIRLLCAASRQPQRGRFRDREVLDLAVGVEAAAYLIKRGDVISQRGRLYVDGWDEWQEGDLTVGERMTRVRAKRAASTAGRPRVTGELRSERNSTVSDPSLSAKAARRQASRHKALTPPHAAAGHGNEGQTAAGDQSSSALPDHDPRKPLEAELAGLVAELARLTSTAIDDVLESVSATPGGKHLTHIRGASPKWLRQSIRDCARFRSENVVEDEAPAIPPA